MAEYVSAVYNFLYKKKDTDSNVELLLGYQGNPFLFNNWNYTKEDINLTAKNITFNCEKFSTSGTGLKIENNELYKQVNETYQGEENSWASPVYHYRLNTAYTNIDEFYTAAYKEVADGYRSNWMLINNKWVLSSTMSHFTVLELDWDQLRLYSNRYSASGGWSGFYERPLTVNSAIFADEDSTNTNSIHNRLNALDSKIDGVDSKVDSISLYSGWASAKYTGNASKEEHWAFYLVTTTTRPSIAEMVKKCLFALNKADGTFWFKLGAIHSGSSSGRRFQKAGSSTTDDIYYGGESANYWKDFNYDLEDLDIT